MGNELDIHRYITAEEAGIFAGASLNKLLEDNKNKPVLLLLSSGSALQILDGVDLNNISELNAISVLDERHSVDEKINNFAQLQKTDFYIQAMEKDAIFFGTMPRPNETKEQLADRFENNLRKWKTENPQGKIIATLGMGHDGHIAGIMPFAEDEKKFEGLFLDKNWAAAYDAGDKNKYPLRVTTTITFLKTIDACVAFITGTPKQPAFDRLLAKKDSVASLPAMVFWEMKNLEIYTDLK